MKNSDPVFDGTWLESSYRLAFKGRPQMNWYWNERAKYQRTKLGRIVFRQELREYKEWKAE